MLVFSITALNIVCYARVEFTIFAFNNINIIHAFNIPSFDSFEHFVFKYVRCVSRRSFANHVLQTGSSLHNGALRLSLLTQKKTRPVVSH